MRVCSLIRAFGENAREMVADETPTSFANSLEVIRSFTQFTISLSWQQDVS